MANAANIVENAGRTTDFICVAGNTFTKGDICWFGTARLLSGASTTNGTFAGIVAADKEANDGALRVSCHTQGIFDCVVSHGFSAGDYVTLSGQNLLSGCGTTKNPKCVGLALENGTAGSRAEIAVGYY